MFTIYPEYSKKRVNRAGVAIRENVSSAEDIEVIENWRASHNYVLNTFQSTLRRHAREKNITVAQRLKRKNTIYDKLKRQQGMQLARMHDIAGCRLIFDNIEELNSTRTKIRNSRFKHKSRNDEFDYDYIANPKQNGYRGIHDIFEYVSYSGTANKWDGLLIELQYRTKVQHAWATAVEIVGSLTGNEAKFDRGDPRNQRFFTICSEILARHYENSNSCLPNETLPNLLNEYYEIEKDLGIISLLNGIHISAVQLKNARNLILQRKDSQLTSFGYSKTKAALEKYFELENESRDADIVLVRADTNEGIRSAFRNYFSDARDFTALIANAVK